MESCEKLEAKIENNVNENKTQIRTTTKMQQVQVKISLIKDVKLKPRQKNLMLIK